MLKISLTILTIFLLSEILALNGMCQAPIPSAYTSTARLNYVRTWVATAPDPNPSHLLTRPISDVKQSTQYFDGYGRHIETVAKQASPTGYDFVTASVYDIATANEIYKYLPFSETSPSSGDFTNDGNFKLDRFHEQVAFYNSYLVNQPGETTTSSSSPNWAYRKTNFEASPMVRILNAFAPGVNWVGTEGSQNRKIQQGYLTNTASDNVIMWTAATNKSGTNQFTTSPTIPVYQGTYSINSLFKSSVTDEKGNQVIQFTDQYGQVILKKVQNTATADNGTGSSHAGWLCTYYIYDDYGNLRFILTPNIIQLIDGNWSSITQAYVDELCYYFEYDNQNRVVTRKSPGTPAGINGEVWMVYDQRGRLVMQQDGYQRSAQKWKYFQYDALDRVITTGFIIDPSSNLTNYNDLTTHTNNAASSISYPNLSGYSNEVLTQAFYDNYYWMSVPNSSSLPALINNGTNGSGNSNFLATSNTTAPYAQTVNQSYMIHGMATGTKIEVLGTNDAQFIYSVSFFDSKGRNIQTQTINYSGGTDISTNQYDWSGKGLVNLLSHTLSSSVNPQVHNIATVMSYDAIGRLLTVTKNINSTVNGVSVSANSLIETNQYDEQSNLKKRTFGNNLESITYDFNVRGWMLGGNRDFAKTALSTTNYFGFDLGYDQATIAPSGGSSIGTYSSQIYNGNISGTLWKSRSDGVIRKFDYTYDNVNRLLTAPYNESAAINSWSNSTINFSVSNLNYDGNGNIGAMEQYGFLVGGSQPIDNLIYNYSLGQNSATGANYSNRLQNVIDNSNNPQSVLGDIHYPLSPTKTSSSADYGYNNPNGSITSDYNRNISNISYYYDMDLPNAITVTNKGTVQYAYDAAGNKLQKQVIQANATVVYSGTSYTTNITTTTKYLDGFTYKTVSYSNSGLAALNSNNTDVLQFTSHEEGRIRYVPGSPSKFAFDYFMRDHLGNVRMILTDEQQTDIYPPTTVETTSQTVNGITSTPATFESQYYNINPSNIVPVSSLPWWSVVTGKTYYNSNGSVPTDDPYSSNPTTTASSNLYKLSGWNGTSGNKTGLGITLKVMAGDVVNIYGKSVWHNSTTTATYQPITASLLDFFSAFATSTPVTVLDGGTVTASTLSSASATTVPLTSLLNGTPSQTSNITYAPKAAINWILFDDQFRPVAGSLGTSLVSSSSDYVNDHTSGTNAIPRNISMAKSGYLYVYCSNESNVDVYFDNLQVTLAHGPLTEETHYYPMGLAMAGISDRAWGKTPNYYHYQGKEMQDQEWNDGSGLEEYDFGARFYDQQIGLWHAQDPAGQYASPYLAMNNSWMNSTDPDGRFVWFIPLIIGAIAGGFEGYHLGHEHHAKGWSMVGYILGGAGIGALSAYEGGEIAAAGGAFSNTTALIMGSAVNSMGMNALSGGQTDVTISFGIGEYDMTKGSFGYLGKKGNSFLENFGFGLGALANIQDALAGLSPTSVKAEFEDDPEPGEPGYAKGKDLIGHTEILTNDNKPLIDFGPKKFGTATLFGLGDARNDWTPYSTDGLVEIAAKKGNLFNNSIPINGVNLDRLESISKSLNENAGKYNFLIRSCSSVAARALFMSGKLLVGGIYPDFLRLSAILNDAGVRPSIFSYFLND